jgi:hypothetical protein
LSEEQRERREEEDAVRRAGALHGAAAGVRRRGVRQCGHAGRRGGGGRGGGVVGIAGKVEAVDGFGLAGRLLLSRFTVSKNSIWVMGLV